VRRLAVLVSLAACGDGELAPVDAPPVPIDAAVAGPDAAPPPDGYIPPDAPDDDSGVTYLPDLIIVDSEMQSPPVITTLSFASTDPAVVEGCVGAAGSRRLLKFDTVIGNIGNLDLWVGVPSADNPWFEWSPAHGHYHVLGVAEYRLVDVGGTVVTAHKQAFCLMDSAAIDGATGGKYYCGNQGITAGWADVYGRYLDCQWVDITGVPAGDYTLEIEVNPEGRFQESDGANDLWTHAVTL